MKKPLSLIFTVLSLFAQDLDMLLEKYKKESELSKITKRDSAGFVYVYTREDLERMQAYSLKDILKTIPGLNYTIAPNGLYLFTTASTSHIPPASVRLYINDHDLSSTSFGSALLVWGDMPVEYIDHIEVYKNSSSIEFGNEPGIITIKVYTKLPEREEGKKLRVVKDTRGSTGVDTYIAKTFSDCSSLFFYLHAYNYNSKVYENDGYPIKKDKKDFTFYAKYRVDDFSLEASSYKLNRDPFLGNGTLYHPTGGGLNAIHSYIKMDKIFKGILFTVSYDDLDYNRVYEDDSLVYTSLGYVNTYKIEFKDKIFSLGAKKRFDFGRNHLLIGSFYKYKGFEADGWFDANQTRYNNHLNLYSVYAEDSFKFNENTLAILSLKGDFYRYHKEVESKNKLVSRFGIIKRVNDIKIKAFYYQTYIAPQFYTLYSKNDYPLKTDPNLKYPKITIATVGFTKKKRNYKVSLKFGIKSGKDKIVYSYTQGFVNLSDKYNFKFVELNYKYYLDMYNKLFIDIEKGENSKGNFSPDLYVNLRMFNKLGNFNIYNELLYKNSYEYYGVEVESSIDYNAAIKYRINKDFSIGLRGENILNSGFKQAYTKTDNTFVVTDRRFIINLEYLF